MTNQATVFTGTVFALENAAGNITFKADSLMIDNGASISSAAYEGGQAGQVSVNASQNLTVKNGGSINSDATYYGASGDVGVRAGTLALQSGGSISANSFGSNAAGNVTVEVSNISIDGAGSQIARVNDGFPLFDGEEGFPAGEITITGSSITLSNGGAVTTNSDSGSAGDISLVLPKNGRVILEGANAPAPSRQVQVRVPVVISPSPTPMPSS